MKYLIAFLLLFTLASCSTVEPKVEVVEPVVSEQEYQDLIERIGELEEEVGNLKKDLLGE